MEADNQRDGLVDVEFDRAPGATGTAVERDADQSGSIGRYVPRVRRTLGRYKTSR